MQKLVKLYIISRCWLSLNRQSDLKLSFPFTLLHASLKGDAPRSPPKASAHAASVMFSDTALLRVIDGCVHLNFRIAKRTAWRHGRVVAWCRTRWRQSSWNSVLWRGPKTQKQRNDIGVCVWAIFLLFWIYFLVLAVFLIIGKGTVPKTLFTKQQENRKLLPYFFVVGQDRLHLVSRPGPAKGLRFRCCRLFSSWVCWGIMRHEATGHNPDIPDPSKII